MNSTTYSTFRVGIAVFIFDQKSGQFVMGKRKGGWEAGTWALPGGHLEHGESFEECAAREVLEETGIVLDRANIRIIAVGNDLVDENGFHYLTVFVGCVVPRSELAPKNLEPEKCEGWELWAWSDVQSCINPARQKDDQGGKKVLFSSLSILLEQQPNIDPLRYYHLHK